MMWIILWDTPRKKWVLELATTNKGSQIQILIAQASDDFQACDLWWKADGLARQYFKFI